MRLPLLLFLALAAATPARPARVEVLVPLAVGLAGANRVAATNVRIGQSAKLDFYLLEQVAADKRAAAGLPPVADTPAQERPLREHYATLPLAQMLALTIADEASRWGLAAGRPVRVDIEVEVLRTGDAAIMPVLGTTDELSGKVAILDADSGARLGAFYVTVRNITAGPMGLALRGAGVREKLAAEFAAKVARALSGRKSPPRRSR